MRGRENKYERMRWRGARGNSWPRSADGLQWWGGGPQLTWVWGPRGIGVVGWGLHLFVSLSSRVQGALGAEDRCSDGEWGAEREMTWILAPRFGVWGSPTLLKYSPLFIDASPFCISVFIFGRLACHFPFYLISLIGNGKTYMLEIIRWRVQL